MKSYGTRIARLYAVTHTNLLLLNRNLHSSYFSQPPKLGRSIHFPDQFWEEKAAPKPLAGCSPCSVGAVKAFGRQCSQQLPVDKFPPFLSCTFSSAPWWSSPHTYMYVYLKWEGRRGRRLWITNRKSSMDSFVDLVGRRSECKRIHLSVYWQAHAWMEWGQGICWMTMTATVTLTVCERICDKGVSLDDHTLWLHALMKCTQNNQPGNQIQFLINSTCLSSFLQQGMIQKGPLRQSRLNQRRQSVYGTHVGEGKELGGRRPGFRITWT